MSAAVRAWQRRLSIWLTPRRATQWFALSNLAFLGLDIALAHKANDFAVPAEWAPVWFSALGSLLLLPGVFGWAERVATWLDRLVGVAAIAVGVIGMVLHLHSSFFAAQTLKILVYSAPFVAPLSYVGVGLLLLLLRSEEAPRPGFGDWLLLLALGGFVGNFVLSVLDHAQNGFFHVTEWIPVASAAFAVSFLGVALARPGAIPARWLLAVMALQIVVAVGGFGLHVVANLERPAASLFERFVFGAPAFAPLLFADLALLAALGVWARSTAPRAAAPA